MSPQIIRTTKELRSTLPKSSRIGFVPTMGALHDGHRRLLQRARQENDLSVLSIFVNPTQFNNAEDLQKYPSTWASDLKLAEQEGVDFLFAPTFAEIYPDNYRFQVVEKEFSKILCGKDRPGHFDGVLTVVMKLLNLIQPDKAYFGEKDFQQLSLVKEMVEAFFLNVEIVAVPTVREESGLALSSRNLRLSESEKALAPVLYASLTKSQNSEQAKVTLQQAGFRVDYVEDIADRRFAAANLGQVRLIDNVKI